MALADPAIDTYREIGRDMEREWESKKARGIDIKSESKFNVKKERESITHVRRSSPM